MAWQTVRKSVSPSVAPNLADYDQERRWFTWGDDRPCTGTTTT